MRFHVDLQGAAGVAAHDEFDDPVGAAALRRRVLREAKQSGQPIAEGEERLAHDDRLGTAPADPALDRAVRVDDPVGPRPGRGGPLHRHDRGERERPALRLEGADPGEQGPAYDVTPFSLRIFQTFCGVIGMSMFRTPRCHSASTTALAIAGGAPTVADSPTPFAPIG